MTVTVWGKHNFEAEEADEISFNVGEPIIVLEKDEMYNDGWWKGQNIKGEVGLFPMNFITTTPPAADQTTKPSYQSSHPSNWSIQDVADWIGRSGYRHCSSNFLEHNVNGEKLLELTLSGLREIGIGTLTDRMNIMNVLHSLQEEHKVPLVPADSGFLEEDKKSKSNSIFSVSDYIDAPTEKKPNGFTGLVEKVFHRFSTSSRPTSPTTPTSPVTPTATTPEPAHVSVDQPEKNEKAQWSFGKKKLFEEPKMDLSSPDYEGWMFIKIGDNKWKKRYMVLKTGMLHVFRLQTKELTHVIPLTLDSKILPCTTGKTQFSFEALRQGAETVAFSCDTQIGMVGWINSMVIATQPNKRSGPVSLVPIKNAQRQLVKSLIVSEVPKRTHMPPAKFIPNRLGSAF